MEAFILALDPGTKQTGWCLYEGVVGQRGGAVRACGVEQNEGVLVLIREHWYAELAIELFVSQGKRLGNDSIQTVLWTGRFWQAARNPEVVRMIPRRKVSGHMKAEGDVAIRRALIERWGGRDAALGTKTNPGPLARVVSHAWAALAVAVTAMESPMPQCPNCAYSTPSASLLADHMEDKHAEKGDGKDETEQTEESK